MLLKDKREVLLDSIMDNCQDIISVQNLEYNYISCNRAFLKTLNYFHESEVLGKNIKDILKPETYETILKNLNYVLDMREPISYTYNLESEQGIQIISQLSTPIVENGEITGVLSVARNITNEENLKLKLVDKICELNSIIEQKKHLENQKELFLTTLTHDLKNPVQAQKMSLKMLSDGMFGKLNKEQTDIIKTLLESSSYMNNMLYSILKTYKYDNGIIYLNKDYINVNLLIQNCINEVKALASSKCINIKFKRLIKDELLYADFEQIRRVVENIINNAINYSYKNTELNIKVSSDCDKIIFKFSNKGTPIKDKTKVFEKYYTGDALKGTGLGLYLSRKVIEAHNGIIYVESDNDLTSFVFEIPKSGHESNSLVTW